MIQALIGSILHSTLIIRDQTCLLNLETYSKKKPLVTLMPPVEFTIWNLHDRNTWQFATCRHQPYFIRLTTATNGAIQRSASYGGKRRGGKKMNPSSNCANRKGRWPFKRPIPSWWVGEYRILPGALKTMNNKAKNMISARENQVFDGLWGAQKNNMESADVRGHYRE